MGRRAPGGGAVLAATDGDGAQRRGPPPLDPDPIGGERGGVEIFSRRVWVSVDGPGEEWGVKERGMGRPAGPGGFGPVGPRPRGVSFFCFFLFCSWAGGCWFLFFVCFPFIFS